MTRAFELSFWCGTCPIAFERLEGANGTLSIAELEAKLTRGLENIDSEVLSAFAELLPAASYLPMLLRVTPRLVYPVTADDYYANEQVATWGVDVFWGLPENPRTPHYRTFQTAVSDDAHLFEFVVPMVPPNWNDRHRVDQFAELLQRDSRPISLLSARSTSASRPLMTRAATTTNTGA